MAEPLVGEDQRVAEDVEDVGWGSWAEEALKGSGAGARTGAATGVVLSEGSAPPRPLWGSVLPIGNGCRGGLSLLTRLWGLT